VRRHRGLATALALSRKGRASCVLEQNADFAEIGARAFRSGPTSSKMFDVLGLTRPIAGHRLLFPRT